MQVIADSKLVASLVSRLADAVRSDMENAGAGNGRKWGLVGIRSRGDVLAQRLAAKLPASAFEGRVGSLDITLYRDDLSEISRQPVVRTTEVPFTIDGLDIVLVDDVLMTGRSIRAAIQSLLDLGRPRRIWLCVLVDRGGRELPIHADHVALDLTADASPVKLTAEARVDVRLTPTDDRDEVVLRQAANAGAKA